MAEEKENLTNSNQEKQDITKLRQAVLKWIDNEKPVGPRPVQTVVTPPENEKTAIPKDILNIRINKKNKPAENPRQSKGKRGFLKTFLLTAIFLIVVVAVGLSLAIYNFKSTNSIVLAVTKVIPYPVAIVNYQSLSYYDWQKQAATLANFYQKEKSFSRQISQKLRFVSFFPKSWRRYRDRHIRIERRRPYASFSQVVDGSVFRRQ